MTQPSPLHNHSNHSFLDGQSAVKEMVKRAKVLGVESMALTNHGNIFGNVEFYQECKKAGIKPIMGMEAYLTNDHSNKIRHAHHLIILAENETGWNNIVRLTTRANENYYYKPRIDFKDLAEHKEGLIILTACMAGPISYWLFDKMTWAQPGEESVLKEAANIPKAYEYLRELVKIIDSGNLFIEVQDGGIPEQLIINDRLRKMAAEFDLPLVATQDSHYVYKDDATAHGFLKAIAWGKAGVPAGESGFSTDEFYIKSKEEWLEGSDLTEAEVDKTREIASRCNVTLPLHQMRLPKYPTTDPRPSIEILKEKAREGWVHRKIKDKNEIYAARAKHELGDIEQAGLADYFLIVSDITDYCRDNDILLGPSRGSAGGSLISFLLGITQLDPIKYNLIWERFYNAGRIGSMPDIDTDVEKSRRDEVIEYIRQRFGEKRVAQVVTLSSLGAKQVVRDVFKVAGVDENIKNIIAGLIPAKNDDHASISLTEAIEAVPKLKEYAEDDDKFDIIRYGKVIRTTSWRELFDIAQRLEGCYKTSGVHAAAVVIADDDFDNAGIPLVRAKSKDGKPKMICGWDMDTIDAFGLLKVDMLGLATLDVLRSALNMIKERHVEHANMPTPQEFLNNLQLDDKKVFAILLHGHTQGIFQLESNLGKSWSKKCKPTNLEEIAELISLIRPAILDSGMAQRYIDVKDGKEQPSYLHSILKPIFSKTKSILLYQEQVMEICQQVAGMDLKESDVVRKFAAKKSPDKMRALKKDFINKSKKKVSTEIAEEIWEWIELQSFYSFNKSHAVGYAIMAYWTAWVKVNYFIEFICANLQHAKDKANQQRTPQDVIALFINDGKLKNIDVTPPSLKKSGMDFTIIDDATISYGFSHIKNVGNSALKSIKACRKAQSFADFLRLTVANKMNKQVIEALICSGALDGFGLPRRDMKAQYILWAATTAKEREQLPSFPGAFLEQLGALVDESTIESRKANKIKVPNINRRLKLRELIVDFKKESRRDTVAQILMWEKHYLGATLSGSMADLNVAMSGARNTCIELGAGKIPVEGYVDLCVVVEDMREVTVKRGKTSGRQMAFITLSDSTYSLDGSCAFPDVYDTIKTAGIDAGDVVLAKGRVSDRGGLIINKMRLL